LKANWEKEQYLDLFYRPKHNFLKAKGQPEGRGKYIFDASEGLIIDGRDFFPALIIEPIEINL